MDTIQKTEEIVRQKVEEIQNEIQQITKEYEEKIIAAQKKLQELFE